MKSYEKRVKQLLAEKKELQGQADYMQRVVVQMIPHLSKAVVAHILEGAKQPTKVLTGPFGQKRLVG